jgi:DNA primase
MSDILEQIKQNYSIERVAGRLGIELDKNGYYRSPNSLQKSGSVKYYPKSNSWYDFSTEQGGSVIDFYMYYTGVDLQTALKELKEETTREIVPWTAPKPKGDDFLDCMSYEEQDVYFEKLNQGASDEEALTSAKLERLKSNTEIFEELHRYCAEKGFDEKALNYLVTMRGIEKKTLERFRIFAVKNYYETNEHLKKTFKHERLLRSGLFNDKGNLIFAMHRIIIPYLHNGAIAYLRGRYFDKEGHVSTEGAKYIGLKNDKLDVNTAKRAFNFDTAKKMIAKEKLYVTEGEFDAVVLEQNGYNAIAIPGAGNIPSPPKLKPLSRFEMVAVPDNDKAGRKMLYHLAEVMKTHGTELKVKRLPAGVKDVNEFFRNTGNGGQKE